jgi:Cys-rich protein (TIGR01571 family)
MTYKEEPDVPVSAEGLAPIPAPVPTMQEAVAVVVDAKPSTVDVIAPTNMAEGYRFNVDSGGRTLQVAVPAGGVSAGQRFAAIILSDGGAGHNDQTNPHNIPTGRWRDDLCDCCKFGCCHAQCCLSYWCSACAAAQVMTRMNLDTCAGPAKGNTKVGKQTFKTIFIITSIYLVTNWILRGVVSATTEDTEPGETGEFSFAELIQSKARLAIGASCLEKAFGTSPFLSVSLLLDILSIAFAIYVLIIVLKTRSFIRRKYNIPVKTCGSCEDCCCAFWCGCCTVAQMARHTADFERYPATCCSATGLNADAPEIV